MVKGKHRADLPPLPPRPQHNPIGGLRPPGPPTALRTPATHPPAQHPPLRAPTDLRRSPGAGSVPRARAGRHPRRWARAQVRGVAPGQAACKLPGRRGRGGGRAVYGGGYGVLSRGGCGREGAGGGAGICPYAREYRSGLAMLIRRRKRALRPRVRVLGQPTPRRPAERARPVSPGREPLPEGGHGPAAWHDAVLQLLAELGPGGWRYPAHQCTLYGESPSPIGKLEECGIQQSWVPARGPSLAATDGAGLINWQSMCNVLL
ncbi:hypothetical protein CALCODRAFT_232359 [Calocera cornea HHB12733]|uniref:Uncharacterized protein n=1 Tax=Calocera cornea HHB12733 TaxID=1353952 RepID=A0A165H0P6_9BASI|nr:hypothetical protein CALCODRAFT_232359 [Calocera cornea HHB12733]